MDSHRIKVKLGDAEFDAEGSPEAVQAQYEAFLKLLSAIPKPPAPASLNPPIVPPANPEGVAPVPNRVFSNEALDRIFRRADTLSLAALPTSGNVAEDAMLALLYGFLKLESESSVTGTALMRSARVSGVNIDRVDRVMSGLIPDFVLAGGVRKARRYQLNNRGIARAEEIILALQ